MPKHLQVRIEPGDYRRLRMLCALRGCTLQGFLLKLILDCLKSAPEFQPAGEEAEHGRH